MQEEDFEREIKVLVIGNGGVGKTSLIRRFCKGVFTDGYKKTIGVDFMEKTQYVESCGEDVKLMLWDTAGQEEFDSITRTYYRGAEAAVLVFSTVDRESFKSLSTWKQKIQTECGDISMALVQNKVDLIDQAAINSDEAEAMARKLNVKFYRACVKDNLNVAEVFTYLAELVTRRHAEQTTAQAAGREGSRKARDGPGAAKPQVDVDLKPTKQRTSGKKPVSRKFKDCTIS